MTRRYGPYQKRPVLDEFIYSLSNGGFRPSITDISETGHIYDRSVKIRVGKKIKDLIEHNRRNKIGATGDAEIRADYKDYRKRYFTMHLVYRSTSASYVADLEVYFIQKFWGKTDNKHFNKATNLKSHDGFYYLYVVSSY